MGDRAMRGELDDGPLPFLIIYMASLLPFRDYDAFSILYANEPFIIPLSSQLKYTLWFDILGTIALSQYASFASTSRLFHRVADLSFLPSQRD